LPQVGSALIWTSVFLLFGCRGIPCRRHNHSWKAFFGFAKPSNGICSQLIDLQYILDLNCFLLLIALVDADLICPEKLAAEIMGTDRRKSIMKVLRDGNVQPVAYYAPCLFWGALSVGQSIELYRYVILPVFCSQS
jgi:hypothetical protein